MSWLKFQTKSGVLKIKPRWHMRYEERVRRVRVIDLGLILITWWPAEKTGPASEAVAKSTESARLQSSQSSNLLERHLGDKAAGQPGSDPG